MMMQINEVAHKTGLSCKAIRFYEQKKLISAPVRQGNGYRGYSQQQLHELRLLAQARRVGFTLEECRELLRLFHDPVRHSADVKARTLKKVADIEQHICQLEQIRQQLLALADSCPGDQQAHCPIINQLTCSNTDTHECCDKI